MNINFKIFCVHEDLEKNIECEHKSTDVSYLSDNAGLSFVCPVCKKETYVEFNFPETPDGEVKQE
jgi:hypothetical protein